MNFETITRHLIGFPTLFSPKTAINQQNDEVDMDALKRIARVQKRVISTGHLILTPLTPSFTGIRAVGISIDYRFDWG